MGRRVYVIKKVEEVGNNCCFNWNYDEFADLLESLGCSVYREDDTDNGLTRFEMSKEEYVQAMEYLKDLESIKDDEELDYDEAIYNINELGYAPYSEDSNEETLYSIMQEFLDESDKDSYYIHFVVF